MRHRRWTILAVATLAGAALMPTVADEEPTPYDALDHSLGVIATQFKSTAAKLEAGAKEGFKLRTPEKGAKQEEFREAEGPPMPVLECCASNLVKMQEGESRTLEGIITKPAP